MTKIIHVQTLLTEDELLQLKMKSKESTTKEALRVAVLKFIDAE